MPLLGKLDGVADEICDDLAKPPGIADDGGRQVRIGAHQKLEILLRRGRRKQRRDILDRFHRIEGRLAQRHLSGIDFGEVQNVVDDRQKRVAGLDDDVDEGLLPRVKIGLRHQLGHAEHAIHRRADFMAHIGEKFRLGAIGSFSPCQQPLKLFLALFHFGDVGEERDPMAALADRRLHVHPALAGHMKDSGNRLLRSDV
ncbi:hypothetical protein AJ87_13795 [Rhizobium yanglingense]|nr:hypothetical protein AJ87_13795 [Rhizobium yanglingense]